MKFDAFNKDRNYLVKKLLGECFWLTRENFDKIIYLNPVKIDLLGELMVDIRTLFKGDDVISVAYQTLVSSEKRANEKELLVNFITYSINRAIEKNLASLMGTIQLINFYSIDRFIKEVEQVLSESDIDSLKAMLK